ncbi:MAG: methyl-accepting chemotaxis protein [Phycisphaerales bacterium]|nr:methyl-accepting chemotaxis protein [Phycisphaerales bacterium]
MMDQNEPTRDDRVPRLRGLLARILLAGVLPTVLVIAGLVWLEARHEYDALQRASLEALQARADLLAKSIQDVNESARESVLAMADAQAAGMVDHTMMSIDFSRSILEREADVTAVYLAFEEGQHASDDAVDLPDEALTVEERVAPYWFIDPDLGDTIQLRPATELDTGEYYAVPKARWAASGDRSMSISEPYLNDGRLQIDMSAPIIVGGQFIGVAGVGRALADQETQIRDFLEDSEDAVFLLSPQGRFIATSEDEQRLDDRDVSGLLKTQSVESAGYGPLFGPMLSGVQVEVLLAEDPSDGERYFYAASGIATGDWLVIVRRSRASVLEPILAYIMESVVLAVIGIIAVILFLGSLAISVSRRVRRAVDRASRVAEGDLRAGSDVATGSDETGVLLRVMDRMGERLRGMVGYLIRSGEAVEQTAGVLSQSSHEQMEVATSLGNSTMRIGEAVDRITTTSSELSDTVASVTDAADQTSALATDGRNELEDMQSAMKRLEAATESIATRLQVINERAAGITGIVSTITSVADQTNLLSVNASIEAEKAGEAGRGFLVVAREIRRLADRSASATLEIESSVKEVETAIGEGVREMSRFSAEVGRIVTDVTGVSEAMGAIIEQVAVSTSRFHTLRDGVLSQAQGAEAIADSMGDLRSGSDRTIRTTEALVQASEDLRQAVEDLGGIVSSFQLDDEPAG